MNGCALRMLLQLHDLMIISIATFSASDSRQPRALMVCREAKLNLSSAYLLCPLLGSEPLLRMTATPVLAMQASLQAQVLQVCVCLHSRACGLSSLKIMGRHSEGLCVRHNSYESVAS